MDRVPHKIFLIVIPDDGVTMIGICLSNLNLKDYLCKNLRLLLKTLVTSSIDSGLVLIWCTHSEKQQAAIKDWAHSWEMVIKAKWFWLKVRMN